jgi:hypothetical protein
MTGRAVRTFSCPACGGQVALRAAGYTVTAICEYCSTVIDTANENFRIIQKSKERTRLTTLPMGAKGILRGTKWEVIGYMSKEDMVYGVSWDEYLLFNPYFGFRFLVASDGHWSLARVIKQTVSGVGVDSEVVLEGEPFLRFDQGRGRVQYVKGEFYWRVRKGDTDSYADYIAPPRMLSLEQTDDELTLSVSDYLQPAEVGQAFGVDLPRRRGIAANQPKPFMGNLRRLWVMGLFTCALAYIIQSHSGSESVLQRSNFHLVPAIVQPSYSTEVFNVPSRADVVLSGGATPLRNNWVDLDVTLVKDASNDAYYATQSLEYYSGVDEGEAWSEGSPTGDTYFSAVEPGNYRVVIQPAIGQIGPDGMDLTLSVRHNVPAWGNFWLTVLLVLLVPVYAAAYRWYFEYRRWRNSDYAPAIYNFRTDSDDD